MSAVLSQYVAKGLQRWGISTDPDIENKYVYLDRSVFQNRQKARPNDPSIKYAESAFTKHNHLYCYWFEDDAQTQHFPGKQAAFHSVLLLHRRAFRSQ